MKTLPWLLLPFALFFLLLSLFGVRELPDRTEADDPKGEPAAIRLDPVLPAEKLPVKPARPLVAAATSPRGR